MSVNLLLLFRNHNVKSSPQKHGEAILHAFNATYQQIRENMSEFARCHYGYIQIPPVTTFRADGPETPEEEKGYWFHAYQPEDLCTIHNPMGDLQDFIALVKDAKNLVSISFLIIPLTLWELG